MCPLLPVSTPPAFSLPPLRLAMQADSPRRCGDCCDRSRSPRGCDAAAHRQIVHGMSHLGRAMAFAARVWDANRGRFSITTEQATWYAEHIDAAIGVEHEWICSGHVPRQRFTIDYVEELLATRPTSVCPGRELSAISEATATEIL